MSSFYECWAKREDRRAAGRQRSRRFVLVALAIMGCAGVFANPTPAGTIISNQAQATIHGEQVVSSNRVDTIVQPVCRPHLGPAASADAPSQTANLVPPATAYLPYVLTNQGNTSAHFAVGHAVGAGSEWVPDAVDIFEDVNANGLIDENEQRVDELTLAAGEHRRLVLAVIPPANASGRLTVTPTADCGDLAANDAYARITARTGLAPALSVQLEVAAGRRDDHGNVRRTVTALLANYGGAPAAAPKVEVDLTDAVLAGFSLDPLTITSDKGLTSYEVDGAWVTAAIARGAQATRVRLELSSLAPSEAARLSFELIQAETVSPGLVPITAEAAEGGSDPVRSVGYLDVAPAFAHTLERLEAEPITLIEGQPRCLTFRLTNSGTSKEIYSFHSEVSPALQGAHVTLRTTSGLPLPTTTALAAGSTLDLALCIVVQGQLTGPLTIALHADGASGERATTTTVVTDVAASTGLSISHVAELNGTVSVNARINYTLTVRNDFSVPLHNVRVRNDLDENLVYEDGSEEYTSAPHVARWHLGTMAAGETVTLQLGVRVAPDAADNTLISNRFAITADELPDPQLSDTIHHTTWSTPLLLETSVTPTEGVTYGDVLTYALRISNPSSVALTITVQERLAAGVEFLDQRLDRQLDAAASGAPQERPGTSNEARPQTTATSSTEPGFERMGDDLTWSDLPISSGEIITVWYRARVLPSAPGELKSRTVVTGESSQGAIIGNSAATLTLRLDPGVFGRDHGVLLGRAYIDRDGRDGFNPEVDEPLAGVRLILGGGQQAVTDANGNYAFRGVPVGMRSLLVDPASLPLTLRSAPNKIGTHRYEVRVYGITVHDVPAQPPAGSAAVAVVTELVLGPLTVTRRIVQGDDGDEVHLSLRTTEPLMGVMIIDQLADGTPWLHTIEELAESETVSFHAGGAAVQIPPNVRWRYP